MGDREQTFQRHFQNMHVLSCATLGGWTRKLQEIEEHRAHFGKINDSGQLFVQSGRKVDPRLDDAIDFFGCLPDSMESCSLVIARHVTPRMLIDDEWFSIRMTLYMLGVKIKGDEFEIPKRLAWKQSNACTQFWKRWQQKKTARKVKCHYPAGMFACPS